MRKESDSGLLNASLLFFTFLSELCTYSNCLHEVGEQFNNYISDLNKCKGYMLLH